jgi:hypothetical protein
MMCTCSWGRITHIAPNTRLSFSHFAFLIFLNHSQIHTKIRVQAAYFVQYLLTLVQSINDCFTTIVKCSRDNAQQQIVSTKQNRCAPKKIIAFISSIVRKEGNNRRLTIRYLNSPPHSICFWTNSPMRARAAWLLRFPDHTQLHTAVCRTPLDEGSARRRDLYLTARNIHNRQTSIPPAEFEPAIAASERT